MDISSTPPTGQARNGGVQATPPAEFPTSRLGAVVDTGFITRTASVGERMLILKDIQTLMSGADMGLMDAGSQPLQQGDGAT